MQPGKPYIPKHKKAPASASAPQAARQPNEQAITQANEQAIEQANKKASERANKQAIRQPHKTNSPREGKYPDTRGHGYFKLTLALLLVLLLIGSILFVLIKGMVDAGAPEAQDAQSSAVDSTETEEALVTFVAVGDNLPEISIGAYGDAQAGELGDGLYDYSPVYEPIKPYIESADLAYLCFETHAGGDEIGPRGWPSFNTTEAMVDAVANTGFDLIASATNHSYDWGFDALAHSAALWEQHDVLFTGTAASPERADAIKTMERNGIVFSLLSYTYGVNGYEESEIPAHAVNYMHEDRIQSDIAAARQLSDVVMVAMHWGTENFSGIDETQRSYAQLIADAGADLVLGSHPHVIGPVAWVEGSGGNKTLVAYSLGNFLSHHDIPYPLNELGGMLSCDFIKDSQGVRIENVAWTPLVNHSEEAVTQIYRLEDYTVELASRHRIFSSYEDPLDWLSARTVEVIGPEIRIIT